MTERFISWEAPAESTDQWRSRLPRWTGAAVTDLAEAPGVADVIAALVEAEPRLAGPFECVQTATAAYDESGFTAAAITTLGCPTGVPDVVSRTFRRVQITFDRPHAVIAIARGGPWEGVPLFSAWVTPGPED
ncbi:MAG: hypothetical protein FGM52_06640 [Mycobacterium sp.]|nr:hypothetical protein [Mycobacterium sp.]